MLVHDNGNKSNFFLFDNDVAQLIGRQAADILDNYLGVDGGEGAWHEIPFPQCIFDAIGQTHKFESQQNFLNSKQRLTNLFLAVKVATQKSTLNQLLKRSPQNVLATTLSVFSIISAHNFI